MQRSLLWTMLVILVSSFALGQTVYSPPGISPTIPSLQVSPIVVTPPAATIPSSPPVTPITITPPVTKIPLMTAVPPPIEPDPTTRLNNAARVYSDTLPMAPAGLHLSDSLGVAEGSRRVEDGTQGRSLGEIAREKRRCTPKVTGRTFSNEDFERVSGVGAVGGPTILVEVACAAENRP